MNKTDIKEAEIMLSSLDAQNQVATDLVALVEGSLLSFLDFRIKALKKELDFQDEMREILKARIPEADFRDIANLLETEERHTNNVTSNVLNPFIPKMQENDAKKKKTSVEEDIFNESSKENLQAFNEMFQMLNTLKASMTEKKNTTKMKDALKESLEEEVRLP